MKNVFAVSVVSMVLALSSCGGGGGGGGVAINYEGAKTPIALDGTNALSMGERVYESAAVEDVYYNPVDPGSLKVPVGAGKQLAKRAVTRLASESYTGSCGGSVTLSGSGSSARATFSDFCSDGMADPQIDTESMYLDGSLALSFSESVSGTDFTGRVSMTFNLDVFGVPGGLNPLAVTRGTLGYLVHGKNAWDTGFGYDSTYVDETFSYDLLVGNPDLAYMIWFNDFVNTALYNHDGFEESYSVEGRIYFSDQGYLDLSTATPVNADGSGGDLRVKGASNSWLKIVITPTWIYNISLETGDNVPPLFDDPIPM